MDFIGSLPTTDRNFNDVTVFVDKLTKLAHFVPSTTSATAVDVAHQIFDNIFKLHGLPTSIISDRDARFTSRFWQELHELLDVKLALSTIYHPRTDGQTEVMNKTLKTMLRAFVDNKQSNWDQLLPSLEFAYNNAINASTGYSPFFLSTGQHPRLPTALLSVLSSSVPIVDNFLTEQATALILAQDALQRAQYHQGEQANKRRRDHQFKVGDKVLLSAANITIPADSTRPADKLRPQYLGPFTLLEQHSPVTFRVELPPSTRSMMYSMLTPSNLFSRPQSLLALEQ